MKIIGRTERNIERLQDAFTVYLGREFEDGSFAVKDKVLLDINEPHMMLICGKRGYGKSYTMAVLVEEILSQPSVVKENVAVVVIDPMGIFWTMQRETRDPEQLSEPWALHPKGFDVTVFYPQGLTERYSKYSEFFHKGFRIYPSELEITDWLYLLEIGESQAQAGLLVQLFKKVKSDYGKYYSINDILNELQKSTASSNLKQALERRLEKVDAWGIFSDMGERIEDIVEQGRTIIIDLSGTGELPWNVRTTLTAILARKLYSKRTFIRNEEEISKIYGEKIELRFPLIWLFIDEAHVFAPSGRTTPATDPLVEWVRQGRRPGLSLVLATQQPGALDRRILSQCDTLIVQRLTAGQDSAAIGSRISEIYGARSIVEYMRILPKQPGYAIVLNDLTEEIVPVKVRPRQSWDGGGSAKLEEYVEQEHWSSAEH